MRKTKHPGFEHVAQTIAHSHGISLERGRAILAAATRRAGPKARRANPRLNRVRR
jgi:hypothetical protein